MCGAGKHYQTFSVVALRKNYLHSMYAQIQPITKNYVLNSVLFVVFTWMKGTTTSEKCNYLWNMKRKRGKEKHTFGSTYKPNSTDSQMFMLLTEEKF